MVDSTYKLHWLLIYNMMRNQFADLMQSGTIQYKYWEVCPNFGHPALISS